jgi:hypothetical protein
MDKASQLVRKVQNTIVARENNRLFCRWQLHPAVGDLETSGMLLSSSKLRSRQIRMGTFPWRFCHDFMNAWEVASISIIIAVILINKHWCGEQKNTSLSILDNRRLLAKPTNYHRQPLVLRCIIVVKSRSKGAVPYCSLLHLSHLYHYLYQLPFEANIGGSLSTSVPMSISCFMLGHQ